MPQGLSFQQFHGDEGSTIAFVNLIDRADVRMVQGGRGLGFALETTEGLWVVGGVVGKKLQGNMAIKLKVLGFIDDAHPTTADLAQDAVVRDRLPDGFGGSGH
jgi:hypothetical protein